MKIFQSLFINFLKAYRYTLAPLFMALGTECRFTPSCSHYAEEAVKEFGPFRGIWLGAKRILRCNPLCMGGFDPVPKKE